MITVFVVVLYDRHIDDVITLHGTKAGAEKRVAEIKAGYDDAKWRWEERAHTWTSYDDGPSIRVEYMEVQP